MELKKKFAQKEAAQGIEERGMQKRFSAYIGVSPAYVSHMFTGVKPMGHMHARGIEEKLKLPSGWMDVDHLSGAVPMDSRAREFGALAMRLYMKWPEEVRALMMRFMEEKMFSEEQIPPAGNSKRAAKA